MNRTGSEAQFFYVCLWWVILLRDSKCLIFAGWLWNLSYEDWNPRVQFKEEYFFQRLPDKDGNFSSVYASLLLYRLSGQFCNDWFLTDLISILYNLVTDNLRMGDWAFFKITLGQKFLVEWFCIIHFIWWWLCISSFFPPVAVCFKFPSGMAIICLLFW